MALTNRQRPVPPSMFTDESLMELPPEVRLTGLGLRFYVDDAGRGPARPELIKGQLWPLDSDVTTDLILYHLLALEEAGYIRLYDVADRSYLVLVERPSIDRPQESRLPPPPEDADPEPLAESSRASREPLAVVGGRKEEEGRRGGREGGQGKAGTLATALAGTPEPAPWCTKHPLGSDEPCGPCGGARKVHEMWVRAQVEVESGAIQEGAA